MPNWFYIDAFGQQQGPVSDSQLKTLAVQGIIEPDTPLETDTGKKGKAGQVKGLFLTASAPAPKTAPPPPLFSDAEIAAIQAERTSQSQRQHQQQQRRPQTRRGESIESKVRDWMGGLGKYVSAFSGALIVLAVFLFFVLTTASLEGKWGQDNDADAPKSIEFFKDGTGTWDGLPITWKKESRKRGRRSYDYYLHFQFNDRRIGGGTVEYSIVFSTLTLMFADGNVKYTKLKGGAATVKDEIPKDENTLVPSFDPTVEMPQQQRQEIQQMQEQMRQEFEQRRQEVLQRHEQMRQESEQRRQEMQPRIPLRN